MKLIDLTDKDRELRQSIIKGLRVLLEKVPSGSTWISDRFANMRDDDIKIIVRWINGLESFTPSRDQNQLDLKFVTEISSALYKHLKAKK